MRARLARLVDFVLGGMEQGWVNLAGLFNVGMDDCALEVLFDETRISDRRGRSEYLYLGTRSLERT
jgi:hypothetical protein